VEIHGDCESQFKGVRDAFADNFSLRGDIGAGVAVVADGRVVVDLWAGSAEATNDATAGADAAGTRPWEQDTLVNVWSSTKGVVALIAAMLADRGELDVHAPVATYWPEFAAAGKSELPVSYLLCHRAGLLGAREPLTVADLYDWDRMTAILAGTEPWWQPGSMSGYHALTYGYLVGEVIRRITGRSVGEFLAREITGPLGIDFHLGLGPSQLGRVATLDQAPPPPDSDIAAIFAQLAPGAIAALANPMVGAAEANTDEWRRAEIPAANGHGTARALATIYGLLAGGGELGGVRLLSAEGVDRAREGQGRCLDLVLGAAGVESEFALGFLLSGPEGLYGPNPRSFGHDGFGGSFGFADPEAGVGVAWVMNHMGSVLVGDPRKVAIIDAVYDAL
jgi:CubicO group peptidase (beta-lactamase class C family)